MWNDYLAQNAELLPKYSKGSPAENFEIVERGTTDMYLNRLVPAIVKVDDGAKAYAATTKREAFATLGNTRSAIALLAFAITAFGLGVALLITRSIKRPLSELTSRFNSLAAHCVPGLAKGMDAFATTDLTVDLQPVTTPVRIAGRDEIGSYNVARKELGCLVQDVAIAARQVQETSGGLALATLEGGGASGEIAPIVEAAKTVSSKTAEVAARSHAIEAAMARVADSAAAAERSSKEMDAQSGEVSHTLTNVAAVSEQTAAGAEELSAMSEGLERMVSRFRIEEETPAPRGKGHLRLAV